MDVHCSDLGCFIIITNLTLKVSITILLQIGTRVRLLPSNLETFDSTI